MKQASKPPSSQPEHHAELVRLNRIIGQLSGIRRMIEEVEYCPNIIVQTQAARSAIKSLESSILERHLEHCVHKAFNSSNRKEKKQKIEELLKLYQRNS